MKHTPQHNNTVCPRPTRHRLQRNKPQTQGKKTRPLIFTLGLVLKTWHLLVNTHSDQWTRAKGPSAVSDERTNESTLAANSRRKALPEYVRHSLKQSDACPDLAMNGLSENRGSNRPFFHSWRSGLPCGCVFSGVRWRIPFHTCTVRIPFTLRIRAAQHTIPTIAIQLNKCRVESCNTTAFARWSALAANYAWPRVSTLSYKPAPFKQCTPPPLEKYGTTSFVTLTVPLDNQRPPQGESPRRGFFSHQDPIN